MVSFKWLVIHPLHLIWVLSLRPGLREPPLEVTLAYNEGQYGSLYLVNLHDNVGSVYSCDMRYRINVSLCKKRHNVVT